MSSTRARRIEIVSFSGIDGAGKTTHIDALCRFLKESGISYSLFTFWDDVVAFAPLRERVSLAAFRGDRGIGSPERPISRRDKNVSTWYLTLARLALYTFDTLKLRFVISKAKRLRSDVVIFDRYIYDELANLPLQRFVIRAYLRLLLKLAPTPDIAFLIDADPKAAVIRKPEYPLEFVRRNREAYLSLSRLVPEMAIVSPLPAEQAIKVTTHIVSERLIPKLEQNDFRMGFQLPSNTVRTSNH